MNIYEHAIFSNFVYTIEIDNIDNDKLKNFILNLEKITPSEERSNAGGWQSDITNCDNLEIKLLLRSCTDVCQEVSNTWNLDQTIVTTNSWININRKHNFNYPHYHPRSVFSGVYYVETPINAGNLVIKRPDSQEHYIDNLNSMYTQKNFSVTPKIGLLVVFPSYLNHFVEQNLNNDPRISISMNFNGVDCG